MGAAKACEAAKASRSMSVTGRTTDIISHDRGWRWDLRTIFAGLIKVKTFNRRWTQIGTDVEGPGVRLGTTSVGERLGDADWDGPGAASDPKNGLKGAVFWVRGGLIWLRRIW